jgi:hypothetical protein
LFEGGFEIFDDSQGENVEIREVIRFFEALSLSHKIARLASRGCYKLFGAG